MTLHLPSRIGKDARLRDILERQAELLRRNAAGEFGSRDRIDRFDQHTADALRHLDGLRKALVGMYRADNPTMTAAATRTDSGETVSLVPSDAELAAMESLRRKLEHLAAWHPHREGKPPDRIKRHAVLKIETALRRAGHADLIPAVIDAVCQAAGVDAPDERTRRRWRT